MNYWNRKDVPHKGWLNQGSEDLEEAVHVCDMCGKEEIRYVHTMYHSEMLDYFKVGCVCAENMTNDYKTPKEQIKKMKKKTTWMTHNWKKFDLYNYEEKSFNGIHGRMSVGMFDFNTKVAVAIGDTILRDDFPSKKDAKEFIYKVFATKTDKMLSNIDSFFF